MEHPCYPCRLARHEECIEVGCVCLKCLADSKEEYPMEYPSYLGGSRVCALSTAP